MAKNKIFFDANVVLDIVDSRRRDNKQALLLWEYATIHEYEIYISEDILTNVFYIAKEKTKVLEFFKLIQDRWKIVSFGKMVIKNSVDLSSKHDLDLEDVLQCLCAKENACEVLITNDKKFYDCGIKRMTTKEFLL